ncbi:MAG: demethoxyubiquinone hydroxylase family protein [Candidatus Bathyarchaeia archaeon]
MPDFATAREIRKFDKKLSREELARALRFNIAAEYEAVQIYEQIVEAIDDEYMKAVIRDIINEEKLHAAQFWELLVNVDPEEAKAHKQGIEENKKHKQTLGK